MEDGDPLCFHFNELDRFHDYLLGNAGLETAHTGEVADNPGPPCPDTENAASYGWLNGENDKLYIKLNLQIGFK